MTTTTLAPPSREPQRVSWTEPELSMLADRSRKRSVGMWSVAVVATATDIALMHPAISRALPEVASGQAWLIAVGLGLLALFAAMTFGHLWRGARGKRPGSAAALALPVCIALLWLGLGAWIVWLRLTAETSTVAQVMYDDSGPLGVNTAAGAHGFVAAGTFLFVYLLAGMLAAVDSYVSRNDAWSTGRAERLAAEAAGEKLATAEADYVRLLAEITRRREEIAQIDAEAATARKSNAAFSSELKQLVREELAIAWGDPRRSGVASADHPSNPAGADLRVEGEESK